MIDPIEIEEPIGYGQLRELVATLANRVNLITRLRAVSVESGVARFNFSEQMATLDVPNVTSQITELTNQIENLKTGLTSSNADLAGCQSALEACEVENALLEAEVIILEKEIDILEEVAGPAYFQRSVTGTWNIGGGCEGAINTSNTSISWISGTSGTTTWLRTEIHSVSNTNFPSICATGGITFTFYTQPDGSGSGNGISGDKNERGTKTVILNTGTTYYVYARAVNFNADVDEAAPGEFQGAFTMTANGPVMI